MCWAALTLLIYNSELESRWKHDWLESKSAKGIFSSKAMAAFQTQFVSHTVSGNIQKTWSNLDTSYCYYVGNWLQLASEFLTQSLTARDVQYTQQYYPIYNHDSDNSTQYSESLPNLGQPLDNKHPLHYLAWWNYVVWTIEQRKLSKTIMVDCRKDGSYVSHTSMDTSHRRVWCCPCWSWDEKLNVYSWHLHNGQQYQQQWHNCSRVRRWNTGCWRTRRLEKRPGLGKFPAETLDFTCLLCALHKNKTKWLE